MATPELKPEDVFVGAIRAKAFKSLKLRIYPDKHPDGDTTALFQKAQMFYDSCCMNLEPTPPKRTAKANPNSPPSYGTQFPQDFHVQDKWPFLEVSTLEPLSTKSIMSNEF